MGQNLLDNIRMAPSLSLPNFTILTSKLSFPIPSFPILSLPVLGLPVLALPVLGLPILSRAVPSQLKKAMVKKYKKLSKRREEEGRRILWQIWQQKYLSIFFWQKIT